MKKYLVIAALLLTSGLIFAFQSQYSQSTTAAPATKATQLWYDFIGGDETNPSRYVLRDPQVAPSCTVGIDMCAVKAAPHPTLPSKPDLTDPIKEERREN